MNRVNGSMNKTKEMERMCDSLHFILLTLPLEEERWFKLISEKIRNGIV